MSGRKPLDTADRRTRFELRLSPTERSVLRALTGGHQPSTGLRGLLLATYRDAREQAQSAAIEFFRRARDTSSHASIQAECDGREAWDMAQRLAETGDLAGVRVTLWLRCGAWSAIVPAAAESYLDDGARPAPQLWCDPDTVILECAPPGAAEDPQPGDQWVFGKRWEPSGKQTTWRLLERNGDALVVEVSTGTGLPRKYVSHAVTLAHWKRPSEDARLLRRAN